MSADKDFDSFVAQEVETRSNADVHYHLISGMGGGYMPDGNAIFDTFEDAVADVKLSIEQEHDVESIVPVRSYTEHANDIEEGVALFVGYYDPEVSPHDLGWYYEVTRSADTDADHEDCRAILNGEKEQPLW